MPQTIINSRPALRLYSSLEFANLPIYTASPSLKLNLAISTSEFMLQLHAVIAHQTNSVTNMIKMITKLNEKRNLPLRIMRQTVD
jgi:hypothetical protein